MNLDTRARRAADGLRASTGGVDPMAQITELKREDATRRTRRKALGALAAVVVLAGAGLFAVVQMGGDNSSQPVSPAPAPAVTVPELDLQPGRTVGTNMRPMLVAKAPASWTVTLDGALVWIDADGSEDTVAHISFDGPLRQVWNADRRRGVSMPDEGYANWLRSNPRLTVLADRMVMVDGVRCPQLTITMAPDASGDEVALGSSADRPQARNRWPDYSRGEVGVETVIEVNGKTMVVSAVTNLDDPARAELDAALDMVLSTMQLPN